MKTVKKKQVQTATPSLTRKHSTRQKSPAYFDVCLMAIPSDENHDPILNRATARPDLRIVEFIMTPEALSSLLEPGAIERLIPGIGWLRHVDVSKIKTRNSDPTFTIATISIGARNRDTEICDTATRVDHNSGRQPVRRK
jgi:hypothetical protein